MSANPAPSAVPSVAMLAIGEVRHQRLRPRKHAFAHATYFLLLPLRALRERPDDQLARNHFAALSFHDRDHGDGGPDALAWLEALLAREGIHDADGEIVLQTFPRVFGYTFKPVSFWYCHRADESLAAVVVEVNNTFGERHCYLLHGDELGWGREVVARKVFHVSPFCRVEGDYRFRFLRTAERCLVRLDHHDGDGLLLSTSLGATLAPATAARQRAALVGMPLMTLGVIVRIHLHALALWFKRVPFHRKPAPPQALVTRGLPRTPAT